MHARSLGGLALAVLSAPLAALPAADVYTVAAPSVWRVQTYDADGLPLGQGSAVVIAPDTLVTNCHVLAKAKRVAVRRDKISIDAKLELWDPQRDVCQIKAPNLGAPIVMLGDTAGLKVGQSVYAIGNPQGLDLTMSAGLLSSIRRNDSQQIILLQTSAPISGGSSGGGLFDDRGMLIGLTTLGFVGDAQNLNFAVPADWIRELPQRHARLNKPAATVAAAADPAAKAAPRPGGVCAGAGKLRPPVLPAEAEVADASRLPHASDKMREQYRVFLTCPYPRAFAISEGGKWWYAWSTRPADAALPTDPAERALRSCERSSGDRCFLYAVDDRVVYKSDVAGLK